MTHYIKTDNTGKFISAAIASPDTESFYLADGCFFGIPPTDFNSYFVDGVWTKPLSVKKLEASAAITAARNAEEASGFLAYGKWFDSDTKAIQRISTAVQAAQVVGETFSIEWTCADNSTITLDYSQMIALPAIMAQAANTLHIKARTLKAAIDAATTSAEIDAVVW